MRTVNPEFSTLDYLVFAIYAIVIIATGLYISRSKKGHEKNTEDYFLAGKKLVWWAIGASSIAANISAEQLIGMSGSGYVMGLAIASYEFASAIILIFIGKYFLPIYIKKDIYTMPQFLLQRYDSRVKTGLAVFWIMVYVLVNLTSILYMGALAMEIILGIPLVTGILILVGIAAVYSIYGGLMAVAWTDIIQVVLLVLGGLLTTYISLQIVSNHEGVFTGLQIMLEKVPDKFHMVFSPDNPNYKDIPGMFGIMAGIVFVANTFYWGTNQYTIQRALGAKNIREAQKGVMFAGYIKLFMPLLVVLPGIAAYVILHDPDITKNLTGIDYSMIPTADTADRAYPWLLGLLPSGLKGLAFAALVAAIVSSLASMINSVSTIFTLDIYKSYLDKKASDRKLLTVGRITAGLALTIAAFVAPVLSNLGQAFQYIQEFTGMVSPGIVAIFLLGLFWKRTTSNAALWMAILTLPVSLFFFFFLPQVPFLDRMAYVAFIIIAFGIVWSLIENKDQTGKAIEYEPGMFKTSRGFNIAALGIIVFLTVFYFVFW